jgi:hypothetical protein
MSDALTQVLLRRERILHRIERQRESVADAVAGLGRPALVIDRILGAARVLRAHPAAAVGLLGVALVLRTRSVIGLIGRGIGVWRLFRRVRTLIGHLSH